MNNRVKEMWVNALRSGEYIQTKRALRKSGNGYKLIYGHCCLGVLCDLHAQETGNKWMGNIYLGSEGTLPEDVIIWAGLPQNSPEVNKGTLMRLNDSGDFDFNDIANMIEKEL